MRILILFFFSGLLLFSCDSKSKTTGSDATVSRSADSLLKFISLDFIVDGKPCSALINQSFKDFEQKKEFPLSVFITINTVEKDSNGHPTAKEAEIFNSLEAEILSGLGSGIVNCYIGKTTMNGYRDMIFYIKSKDQKKVNNKLKSIQQKNTRITSYTYENDPDWEAVSEFYAAINK